VHRCLQTAEQSTNSLERKDHPEYRASGSERTDGVSHLLPGRVGQAASSLDIRNLHWIFETSAWTFAFWLYSRHRRLTGDVVDSGSRAWVIAAAAVGGLIGSRIL
jgi:hypothetical protein